MIQAHEKDFPNTKSKAEIRKKQVPRARAGVILGTSGHNDYYSYCTAREKRPLLSNVEASHRTI